MKTIDIHGKPYVMVKDRVQYFNQEYPNGCIQSKLIDRIESIVVFKATVIPDVEQPDRYFTGHAEEVFGSTQINKTSALENCETSAVGRALAMMGIGTEESLASGDEVANAIFKQNDDATIIHLKDVSPQSSPKTAEDGPKCPKCSGGMFDNSEIDGTPKRSKNYDANIKAGKTKGLYQPIYKCEDDKCGGSIWYDAKAGEENIVTEQAPETEAKQQPAEELPF